MADQEAGLRAGERAGGNKEVWWSLKMEEEYLLSTLTPLIQEERGNLEGGEGEGGYL